jgi:hypothetical protein
MRRAARASLADSKALIARKAGRSDLLVLINSRLDLQRSIDKRAYASIRSTDLPYLDSRYDMIVTNAS